MKNISLALLLLTPLGATSSIAAPLKDALANPVESAPRAPQVALDPLTPRLKAPLLPAPQTQNGVALRVVDAGWKSAPHGWPSPRSSKIRPTFYFDTNLLGVSEGQPDNERWATAANAGNTKIVRVSGPNGERVKNISTGVIKREDGENGATRVVLGDVNPAWKSLVAELETLDPAAPADATGEFTSVERFDWVEIPSKAGEKVEVGQEITTAHGTKIRLRSVRFERSGPELQRGTFFDFAVTPPADVPDMQTSLEISGITNQNNEAWSNNGLGSNGNELTVEAVPREGDKLVSPSIKIKESAASLKKLNFYRRFRIEIPVAALLPHSLAPESQPSVFTGQGRAFTVEVEPNDVQRDEVWNGLVWIKKRAGGKESEQWIVREVKGRAGGEVAQGWATEPEYNRQFMRMSGTPVTSDEHSNELDVLFSERPDKFDLELRVEKAARLENFDWLRDVPLPAPGQSLDIRDGEFETDHISIKRVFRFKNPNELAGLWPDFRPRLGGSNLAVVFDVSPVYPGAPVDIPDFRVQDETGRQIEGFPAVLDGDAGRASTDTNLRTIIFALPDSSKSLDLWFNTLETAWSGQSETVTIKDVAGKG